MLILRELSKIQVLVTIIKNHHTKQKYCLQLFYFLLNVTMIAKTKYFSHGVDACIKKNCNEISDISLNLFNIKCKKDIIIDNRRI